MIKQMQTILILTIKHTLLTEFWKTLRRVIRKKLSEIDKKPKNNGFF